MKQIFENMVSEIIVIIILFVLNTYTLIDSQVLTARRIHASAMDQIQASYYTVNVDDLNERIHEKYPKWTLSIEPLSTYKTRKEYRVVLVYQVAIPLFNIVKPGIIEGYVR